MVNDEENQDSKFTWNDSVIISKNTPKQFHPEESGLICGMSRIEFEEIALKYHTKMGDWIYTVEFKDGKDIQIAECFLEKYYNGHRD